MQTRFSRTSELLREDGVWGQGKGAAETLGISTSQVSRELGGDREVSMERAHEYGDIFGADTNEVTRRYVVDWLTSNYGSSPAPGRRIALEALTKKCKTAMKGETPREALPLIAQLVAEPFGTPKHVAIACYLIGNLYSYLGNGRRALCFWEAAVDSEALPQALSSDALISMGQGQIEIGMHAFGRATLERARDYGSLLPRQVAYVDVFWVDSLLSENPAVVTLRQAEDALARVRNAFEIFSADRNRKPKAELARGILGLCEVVHAHLNKLPDREALNGHAKLHLALECSQAPGKEWANIRALLLKYSAIARAFTFGHEALADLDELETVARTENFPLMRREARRLRKTLPQLWLACLVALLTFATIGKASAGVPSDKPMLGQCEAVMSAASIGRAPTNPLTEAICLSHICGVPSD